MRRACYLLLVTLAVSSGHADAQSPPMPQGSGTSLTRVDLQRQLAEREAALVSPDYSESERNIFRAEADAIRARLERGDFRVGDRILLSVQGETLPDTLTVQPNLVVTLGLFGDVSVAGVLRSEIAQHLTGALSGFIRDPVVRAVALMRLSVVGSVGRPGFYTMPAETVLGEALMVAGGPGGNANLESVRIRRGSEEVMEREAVREALRQGLTLDQLNLLAGDQIDVPERRGILATLGIISGVMGSLSFLIWIVGG